MLSCQSVSSQQAASYYEQDDYYTQKGQMPAKWGGQLAERLGLSGEFDRQKFKAALDGNIPDYQWAKKPSHQRAGFDVTFSAPKSVSIQALVKGDSNIISIHDQAVEKAMRHVESLARCRQTDKKITSKLAVDGIAYASFLHDTSRLGDCNLHRHNVILNCVVGPDGRLYALNNEEIVLFQHALDAIYKQELAAGLRQAGYVLIPTKHGFEIDGYTRELILEFSQRTTQIDNALEEIGMSRESSSAKTRSVVNLNTRDKRQVYDHALLTQQWNERVASKNFKLPDIPPHPEELKDEERGQRLAAIDANIRAAIDLSKTIGTDYHFDDAAVRVNTENFSGIVNSAEFEYERSQHYLDQDTIKVEGLNDEDRILERLGETLAKSASNVSTYVETDISFGDSARANSATFRRDITALEQENLQGGRDSGPAIPRTSAGAAIGRAHV